MDNIYYCQKKKKTNKQTKKKHQKKKKKKKLHFTNSTLIFKIPPYSNISCARCNEKLLEGDHKLHFELNSEIGKGLQRVTQSISFREGTLFDLYTEGTFAKERVFRRGNLSGRCLGKSSNRQYELTQSQNGSFNFGARRR